MLAVSMNTNRVVAILSDVRGGCLVPRSRRHRWMSLEEAYKNLKASEAKKD